MNLMSILTSARRAATAAGVATLALAFAGSAAAQTLTCQQVVNSGGFTLTCTGSAPPPPPPPSTALLTIGNPTPALLPPAGGSVTIPVTCSPTTMCAGVTISVTQPTLLAVTAVASVTNGVGSIIVTGIGPLTSGTSVNIPVTYSGNATGISVVQSKASVDVGIGIATTCATTADKYFEIPLTSTRTNLSLSGTQVAAMHFAPIRGVRNALLGSITVSTGIIGAAPAGWTYQISECPGDFTPNPALNATLMRCGQFEGGQSNIMVNAGALPKSFYCNLDKTKMYYFNIKFVDPNGAATCGAGTCAVYTDWIW